MAVQRVLDFERADVLAAADDDVLAAVLDLDVTVGLHHRQVAGVKPAPGERLFGRARVLEVTLHQDVAAKHDLAHRLAVGRHVAHRLGVHHRHAFLEHVSHTLAAVQTRLLRQAFVLPGGPLHRDGSRCIGLGQAIDMDDVEADSGHALDHRCRRRGTGDHATHLVRDAFVKGGWRVDDQAVHDGRGAVVVDAVLADRIEHRLGFHLAQAHMRTAEQCHRPREAPAVAMEHRQRPQVGREMRHGPARRIAHRVQVGTTVVSDNALGVAGGAAGVADRDGVPLVGGAVEPRQWFVR